MNKTTLQYIILSFAIIVILFSGCRQNPANRNISTMETKKGNHILLSKDSVMRDENFSIRLTGLGSYDEVTLQLTEEDEAGVIWRSEATYSTPGNGNIDVDKEIPISGPPLSDFDTMSLLMAMAPVNPGKHPDFHKTSFEPTITELSLVADGVLLDRKTVERTVIGESTVRVAVNEGGVVGEFFYDESLENQPVIIVLGGSDGGMENIRASVMASHGFATLALAYHGMDGLPGELAYIPVEYFGKAIDWISERAPITDPDRIGVTGVSMGADAALLTGTEYNDRIKAVAAINGSGLLWQGLRVRALSIKDDPIYTKDGQPLPYLRYDAPVPFMLSFLRHKISGKAFSCMNMYENSLTKTSHTDIEAAKIKIEEIRGQIMLSSAGLNYVWPEKKFGADMEKRLNEMNFQYDFQHLHLPGVGHLVADPFMPVNFITDNWEITEAGGTMQDNIDSSRKRWFTMIDFFKKSI